MSSWTGNRDEDVDPQGHGIRRGTADDPEFYPEGCDGSTLFLLVGVLCLVVG